MASLVLGVAGAAIGGAMFGPIGASVGWAVGAGIGTALFPQKVEGPRLTDLKLQTSTYGQDIPIAWGTVRIAGNVIWQTDLQEHKTKSGGKGGPSVTTYTYSASFAVLLCEGPIVGLRRIWADSRLIWDGSLDATIDVPFTLYLGTETQMPDPTMEADLGAGNVPAHRGYAYVVFRDLQLESYGNRIPSLTFEIIATGAYRFNRLNYFDADLDGQTSIATGGPDSSPVYPAWNLGYRLRAGALLGYAYTSPSDEALSPAGEDYIRYTEYSYDPATADDLASWTSTATWDMRTPEAVHRFSGVNLGAITYVHAQTSYQSGIAYVWGMAMADYDHDGDQENGYYWLWAKDGEWTAGGASTITDLAIRSFPVFSNGYVYAVTGKDDGGPCYLKRWPAPDGAVRSNVADAEFYLGTGINPGGGPYWMRRSDAWTVVVADDGHIWLKGQDGGFDPPDGVGFQAHMLEFDPALNLLNHWDISGLSPVERTLYDLSTSFVIYQGHIIVFSADGDNDTYLGTAYVMYRMAPLIADYEPVAYFPSDGIVTPLVYLGGGVLIGRDGMVDLKSGITLASIVRAISLRVGLDESQFDVSELPDPVLGYVVAAQMSARAAIEPLQTAYFFDGVESDDLIKFPKRDHEPVATLDDDDLDARAFDADPGPPLAPTRAQEQDLPMMINVDFIDVNADYQVNTQYEKRQTTQSKIMQSYNLAIVMDAAKAKSVADGLMYSAWAERTKHQLAVGRKWALLEPTDKVVAHGRTLRLLSKNESAAGVIQHDTVETHSSVFLHSAVPTEGGFVDPVVPLFQLSDLVLMDLPLLDPSESPYVSHALTAGHDSPSWAGSAIFKSSDAGTTYSSLATAEAAGIYGTTTDALADWTGGNVFDETSTVTVLLGAGCDDLESATELAVLNGSNLAWFESGELIQFKTATLTATRTYRLSGLLRGRLGTEWAQGEHVAGERFALLTTGLLLLPQLAAEIGMERLYKAVSYGGSLDTAQPVAFTDTAISLKCYAPTDLGGGRDASGNLTLQWTRRSRIAGAWSDGIDAPLGEASEMYVVAVWADGTYATQKYGWLVTDAQTTTYTAAQQTAHYGGPQSTLYWTVAQIGARGQGYSGYGVT